jgi:hypothetical protein
LSISGLPELDVDPIILLLEVIIILVGIGTILISLLETVVAFKPGKPGIADCLVYRSILGLPIIEKEINHIHNARLGIQEDAAGKPHAYRIEFETAAADAPLTVTYSKRRRHEMDNLIERINTFIHNPAATKVVFKMGINLWGVIAGIVIILIGIAAILITQPVVGI